MEKVKIALVQMSVSKDKKANIKRAEMWIDRAVKQGAEIVVLPEMFNTPYDNACFGDYAEVYPGETTDRLAAIAKKHGIVLVGGSISERENEDIYNTAYVFDEKGDLIAKHRKMHLLHVDVEGGVTFIESETLSTGNSVTVCDTKYGKIGIAICFDMRFPELLRLMADQGAEMMFIPAAFNMTTGPAHWHLTARMRAVDNQIFVGVVSPARDESANYVAYGHTILCDPWGNVVSELDEKEGLLFSEIDLSKIPKTRGQLPLFTGRRQDVYELSTRRD